MKSAYLLSVVAGCITASRRTLQLFARQSLSLNESDPNLFIGRSPITTFREPATKLDLVDQHTEKQASLVGANGTYSALAASPMLTARYLERQDNESPSAGFWLSCVSRVFRGGRGTEAKIGK